MKSRRRAFALALSLASALALGCGTTAPARFYTLESTATATAADPGEHYAVIVGAVSVPASVDRPQLVVQLSTNQVEIDEFDRWAAPLDDAIARVVAGDLAALLGTPDVAAVPIANFEPTHRVTLDVQRFESAPGRSALVEALWTVRRTSGGAPRSGRSIAQETVADASIDALAAAHSRALAKVSADIAAAIRAESGAPH